MAQDRESSARARSDGQREERQIARERLGQRLRELRDKAHLNVKDAAKLIDVSEATMSKIENGRQKTKIAYVKVLAQEYGLNARERVDLVAQAEDALEPGPFARYLDVAPRDFQDYHEIEQKAGEICVVKTSLIFGPLQRPDYVRALRKAVQPDSTEEDLERSVEFRALRFKQLTRKGGPIVRVILDVAALHRPVGGEDVMADQIAHLARVPRRHRNFKLQVVPWSVGAYSAQEAGFLLAKRVPPEPVEDYVYLENDMTAIYLDEPHQVRRYTEMFEQTRAIALSPEDTISFLDKMVGNL